MRFRWFAPACLTALLGGLAGPAVAQTADTLTGRAHQLAPVEVRALRPERFAVGSRQLTLDSAALSQFRGGSVADVLQARTLLYLKNYGPGQLASIALRGTSARHTAVLWQGFNVNLPSLGEADFAILPLSGAGGVTVQAGPAAALYGNGAIGGVVRLGTEPDWRPGLRGSLQADAGSFGLRGSSLEAGGSTPRLALRTAASWRTARNDYSYLNPEISGLVRRQLENAVLHQQWSFAQDLALRLGAAGELTAAAWLTDTDRDIQPAVGAVNTHARERDQSRRLLLGYRHVLSAGQQWALRGAWFEDVLNYRDDAKPSNSRVRTTQAQAEYNTALGHRASLRLGAEAQRFAAAVDGYGEDITENRGAAFALLRYDPRAGLRLSANLRQALLPGGAAPLTPTLGAEWDLLPRPAAASSTPSQLTLKASAARSYRAPTLNERYWRPGGNPALHPETGLGAELGLLHSLALSPTTTLRSELTGYGQLVDDWVQWTPDAGGLWSPRNLRQVRTRGLELSSALRWQRARHALSLRAAYAYTQAQKTQGTPADPDPAGRQLPFVPPHQANFSLDYGWRGWQLGSTFTWTGYRYTDASATAYLPTFLLLGTSAGYRWPCAQGRAALTLLAQVSNLLDAQYDSYPARPAPPRAAQLSLRLSWR